jgi:hypothetical protein
MSKKLYDVTPVTLQCPACYHTVTVPDFEFEEDPVACPKCEEVVG